jgi:hypothetical protein
MGTTTHVAAVPVKKKTTDFSKLTKNTKMSETQFYSVKSINKNDIELVNDFGEEITLTKEYVEQLLVSGDQYNETKQMSRTDIINLLQTATNVICTVNFNKKVDEKEVLKQLNALYPNAGGKILSKSDFEKAVKKNLADALTGEERTMVGRHYGRTDEFGRIKFIDMEAKGGYDEAKDSDSRQRLVDPRTINWFILRGVKYEVK